MSRLALKLIAENKKTCSPYLDLGNCGLSEVPQEVGELVWLEELSFASEWTYFDGKKWLSQNSKNTGPINNISRLAPSAVEMSNASIEISTKSNPFSDLKQLKRLYLRSDRAMAMDFRSTAINDLSSLCSLAGLEQLDVSKTQVTDLSPLAGLTNLQGLFISNAPVFDLAPLAKLTNLERLDVCNTPITDLSPLSDLANLQQLDVRDTSVTDLSPLSGLANLQQLNVSNIPVVDLSPLSGLANLLDLNISKTAVSDLSPISNLAALQKLNASKTSVIDLSPLSGLVKLRQLYVWETALYNLSPLSNLSNLIELNLSKTRIINLSQLSGLVNLQVLDISLTVVTDLSPLSGLNSLQKLNVAKTFVSDLLPLSCLMNLQKLTASFTSVTDLSPLQKLIEKGLQVKLGIVWDQANGIDVLGCQLTNPPVEIVKQGNSAILNFFREKAAQGTDHLYEAKLLIIGEGGAGKTSLLRRLYQRKKPLPEENETTKGIDIHRHEFTLSVDRRFRLNVWDFGGQEIYHATHQFFLTQRSLYVLVDDTRKDYKTVRDIGFSYWLEVVDLLGGHSPVLIFQNEKGGRSKNIDIAGIKGRYNNVIEVHSGNLELPGAADGLMWAIEFFVQRLPHIGQELPAKWVDIRADIERQAKEKAFISLQDYFEIYRKNLDFDRDKALHLSRYLHDLGVFLHFQDEPLLARTVILQNTWATEAVFKILDDEVVKGRLGQFDSADCARVWRDSQYADTHLELLALMQKFELCYPLPDGPYSGWLAPQLLPPSKPEALLDWAQPGNLTLRYRYEFLPKGIISRLIVRMHRFVQRPELSWISGAVFERGSTEVLVEIPAKGGEIILRARGSERKELLSVISADLDALNDSFHGLKDLIAKSVPCHCSRCRNLTEPEFFTQENLLWRKEKGRLTIECPKSFEEIGVSELLDGIAVKKQPGWGNLQKFFISYSKEDIRYKDNLLKHLTGLRDQIVTWNDRDLLPGEQWDDRIKEELLSANVVLYLVSANSMATHYIQNVELPLVEHRCRNRECVLIPVIVDFCLWENLNFAKYNALPDKGLPVTDRTWVNENEAWFKVVQGIKKIIESGNF